MMLIDAGPLVALAAPRDPSHHQCAEVAARVTSPILTTWPVVTEAVWIGQRWPEFIWKLSSLFESNAVGLHPLEAKAMTWMAEYMLKYENLRPDLADASLMYLAERERIDTIFTLDRRDFSLSHQPQSRVEDRPLNLTGTKPATNLFDNICRCTRCDAMLYLLCRNPSLCL